LTGSVRLPSGDRAIDIVKENVTAAIAIEVAEALDAPNGSGGAEQLSRSKLSGSICLPFRNPATRLAPDDVAAAVPDEIPE
jgi:hypothetical protein